MTRSALTLILVVLLGGCAKAPRVSIATASAQELVEAAQLREVWYHFEKGNVVPFTPLFYGAGVGGFKQGIPVKVQEDFYLVFRKGLPVTISLDGKRRMEAGRTMLMVTPRSDGEGGQVNWVTYLGNPTQADAALEALLEPVE